MNNTVIILNNQHMYIIKPIENHLLKYSQKKTKMMYLL